MLKHGCRAVNLDLVGERWDRITVTTDRTGECGSNGKLERVNDPSTDPQSTDVPDWGTGGLLSNPIDPGNAQTTE